MSSRITSRMFSFKMAPRRVRSVKVVNNNNYSNLSLNDVLCPICRSIFIEPVTLPCSHGFCFPCFEGTLVHANLTCPLCRVRFGSWHRLARKKQMIINATFWNAIKLSFPKEVKRRLNGIDEQLVEPAPIRISSPGSVRREFELQKSKEEERLAKEREAERRASEALIKRLAEEEKRERAEREAKLKLDEQVAKHIAKEIGGGSEAGNSKVRKPLEKYMSGKKQRLFVYAIQESKSGEIRLEKRGNLNGFLSAGSAKDERLANVCDKDDCVSRDATHFKPIKPLDAPFGKSAGPVKVPARTNKVATVLIRPPNRKIFFAHDSHITAFASFVPAAKSRMTTATRKPPITAAISSKLRDCSYKASELSTSPPFLGFDNSNSNSKPPTSPKPASTDRKLQEQRDLEFAKKLHEELNRNGRYRTRNQRDSLRKRQITLDQFLASPKSG